MGSKLLINEYPLQLLPTLAQVLGVNQALFLQQVQYWINNPKTGKEYEGRKWVRNTAEQWQEDNFPFWHVNTIRNIISKLRDQKVLLATSKINRVGYDRTLWYTIDYTKLEELLDAFTKSCEIETSRIVTPIPETTTETTHKPTGEAGDALSDEEILGPALNRGKITENGLGSPETQKLNADAYRERIRQAMIRGEQRYRETGLDVGEYHEDARPIVEKVAMLWNLSPPTKRKTSRGRNTLFLWETDALELLSTCAEFGIAVLDLAHEQYTDQTARNGVAPFNVAGPGSLINTARALVGQLRAGDVSLSNGADPTMVFKIQGKDHIKNPDGSFSPLKPSGD